MEPILCWYCNVPWDYERRRFEHREDCYILTGMYPKVIGRKKRPMPKAEPVKPLLELDDDPGPEAA